MQFFNLSKIYENSSSFKYFRIIIKLSNFVNFWNDLDKIFIPFSSYLQFLRLNKIKFGAKHSNPERSFSKISLV